MTEEEKQEISVEKEGKKVCKCNCKELKMFLLVIFGSFLGCLVALCLFSAIMRPKFPPPMPMKGQPQFQQQMEQGKFSRHHGKHHKFKKFRHEFNFEFKKDQDGFPEDAPMRRGPHPFEDND